MPKASSTKVAQARKEYQAAKRKYHATGKAAFGKPKTAKVKKEYQSAKSAYRRAGNTLGRLTGVKK